MRIASCPHCGMREPVFNTKNMKVTCPRCRNVTQLPAATDFLKKAEALWQGVEVTLRNQKARMRIEQHDGYLKKRGDYDIITATLDENWTDDADDEDCNTDNNNNATEGPL